MRATKLLLLSLLIAASAQAQMSTNLARGFDPEKVYQIGDVDNVNVFNGNLIINIPIGPRFSAGGNMTYGLNLVYNGNPWDYVVMTADGLPQAMPSRFNNVAIGWQLTMGELVSPSDSLSSSLTENGLWIYEGPDGAERPIFPYLHQEESTYPGYSALPSGQPGNSGILGYTRDSSYIRLMHLSPQLDHYGSGQCRAQYRLDFPDGNQHTFESTTVESCASQYGDETALQYRLAGMNDRFQNSVTLTYVNDPPTQIRIQDSTGRQHTVNLVPDSLFYEYSGSHQRSRVTSVNLAAPAGQTAPYTFDVSGDDANLTLASLPCADQTVIGSNRTIGLRFLKLVIRPDGSQYSMLDSSGNLGYEVLETDSSGNHPCSQDAAHIKHLGLPTGGYIDYEAGIRRFPHIPDPATGHQPLDPNSGLFRSSAAYATSSIGLTSRTLHTGGTPDQTAEWDYTAQLQNPVIFSQQLGDGTWKYHPVHQEEVVFVTDPASKTTAHYFNVYRQELEDEGVTSCFVGGDGVEYGLPFTRRSAASNGTFLSTEAYDGKCATLTFVSCTNILCSDPSGNTLKPAKATFVDYETDSEAGGSTEHWGQIANSRQRNSRTEFRDATTSNAVLSDTDVSSSDFDGLGHYRTEVTSSTISGTPDRTVTTHYNSNTYAGSYVPAGNSNPAFYMIPSSSPWLTSLYDRVDTTQDNHTARQEFGFDLPTGFLLNRRTLKDGTAKGCSDLLAVFTSDHGNVNHEAYFGGDYRPLGTVSPCASPAGTADYGITHTYLYGSLQTSQYDSTSSYLYPVNNTIDLNSGLVTTSRDTAGLATTYTYDNMFRLKTELLPGGVTTTLNYTMSSPSVTVDRSSVNTPVLAKQRFYYDGLGRLIQSKALMPDGWSTVVREYDSLSRLKSVSQPVYRTSDSFETLTGGDKTILTYDYLGRKLTTTSPDSTVAWQTYNGVTSMDRGALNAAGVASPPDNSVTESYDGYGRLASVKEKSGPPNATYPTGTDVTSTYTYDGHDHLTSVKMEATNPVAGDSAQNRLFDYDGRGLLRWESQPESGMTSYEYDARGHVRSKTQSAANSIFDQKFTFDPAERLTRVDGRNPYYDPADSHQPQFRPIKEFVFQDTPDPNNAANLRLGKLTQATRHNYGERQLYTGDESEFEVSDVFEYDDAAGRKTKRTTSITEVTGGVGGTRSPVRDIAMGVDYNDFDLPSKIYYPTCVDCGLPPMDPDRGSMTRTYDTGRLTALPGYVSSLNYWPNGMRNVLQHTNGIADTQTVTNMPRPSQLSFDTYDRCAHPTFATQPVSGVVNSPGDPYPLSVVVNGTGPFVYDWRRSTDYSSVGTTASITVNPTQTTEYSVYVTGPCGHELSESAKVTIGGCATPSTGVIQAILQPDGSWILKPNPEVRATDRTFSWTHPPDTMSLASSETFRVNTLSTTTYRFTVSDYCGSASGDVTITVPLPITSNLVATASGSNQIAVTWPAISGAAHYTVQRRSGGTWDNIATIAATTPPSYTDTSALPSTTYVYHVASDSGGSTNYDVATTMTFTAAVPGQPVTPVAVNDMLNAVNGVRAAVGWPAVTWSSILASTDPLPAPESMIMARQILSCRARMNEALQALGVAILPYANPDLSGEAVRASDINEIQQRSQ